MTDHRLNAKEMNTVKLGIDICDYLEEYHVQGKTYGTVSMERIGRARDGEYVLVQAGNHPKEGNVCMAPELFLGGNETVESDLYSLGLTMYILLNGNRLPFIQSDQSSREDMKAALKARIQGVALPIIPGVDEELNRIIAKACSYDVGGRYDSAKAMQQDLKALAASEAVELTPLEGTGIMMGGAASAGMAADETLSEFSFEENDIESDGGDEVAVAAEESPKKSKKPVVIAIILIVAALIAGTYFVLTSGKVTAINGTEKAVDIYLGETYQTKYTLETSGFYKDDPVITYKVKDESIATVDKNGKLTAKKIGKTTMAVAADEYKTQVKVEVVPKVTKISGVEETVEINKDDTKTVKPKLEPEKFKDEPISYSIGDTKIATVDENGKITAKKDGTTTLTIRSGGCEKTVKIKVTTYVAPAPTKSSPKKSSGGGHSSGHSSGGGGHSSGGSDGGSFN